MTEVRPGERVETHAILLAKVPVKEADLILQLFTVDFGKISAYAVGAARSRKRFQGALEAMNHVKVQLRVPRDQGGDSHPLWSLEQADLQSSFPHLRTSYEKLESAMFVTRQVHDFLPEGSPDKAVFQSLGRYLRDSAALDFAVVRGWPRFAFWTWLTHHLGFGDLSKNFEARMPLPEQWPERWHACLAVTSANFEELFRLMKASPLPPLAGDDELRIYERWLELSGIPWRYFENWLTTRV